MAFKVPTKDILFSMRELAGLDNLLKLPDFEARGIDLGLIQDVLDENAKFVEGMIAPLNRAGDISPPQWHAGSVTTTPGFADAFKAYGQGGWQGLSHPEEWGGQALPKLVAAATCENINAANLAFSLCPLLTDGVIEALLKVGSQEQRKRFVPSLISGKWTGTMNLTEPQAGSDLAQVTTRAVPQDDGTFRIRGQKIYITFGEHDMAENIVHLVLGRTPNSPAGVKGISLFIVSKFLVDEAGESGRRNDVHCDSIEHKLGIHGSPTAVLSFGAGHGDVGEGAIGELVGEENRGLEYMFIMMNAARFAVGQQGIAVSERSFQHALAYARERVQGRAVEGSSRPVSIVHHPDVQRMLLTMRALTEATRAVAFVAAAAHDRAVHGTDASRQAADQSMYEYLVPIIKGFGTESSLEVTSLGIQVHGGMGFIEETGAAQFYRDARILPIYEGTTAIQSNDLLGRKTFRDAGATAQHFIAEMRATLAEMNARQSTGELGSAAALGVERRPGWLIFQSHFEQAIQHYETATTDVLGFAKPDVRAAFAGSVPYLMLAGVVHGGWQMARSALACEAHLAGAQDSDHSDSDAARGQLQDDAQQKFYTDKLDTALFYGAHILPRSFAYATAVSTGDVAQRAGQSLIS